MYIYIYRERLILVGNIVVIKMPCIYIYLYVSDHLKHLSWKGEALFDVNICFRRLCFVLRNRKQLSCSCLGRKTAVFVCARLASANMMLEQPSILGHVLDTLIRVHRDVHFDHLKSTNQPLESFHIST